MAKPPIEQIKVGSIEIAKWEGEYEGKPTNSWSLKKQKFDPKTNKSEVSPFLTVTDLKDIILACQQMLLNHYGMKKDEAPF